MDFVVDREDANTFSLSIGDSKHNLSVHCKSPLLSQALYKVFEDGKIIYCPIFEWEGNEILLATMSTVQFEPPAPDDDLFGYLGFIDGMQLGIELSDHPILGLEKLDEVFTGKAQPVFLLNNTDGWAINEDGTIRNWLLTDFFGLSGAWLSGPVYDLGIEARDAMERGDTETFDELVKELEEFEGYGGIVTNSPD